MYFKRFFTCLERTSTHITSKFRTIYSSSSPKVSFKKDSGLQICSIFTEEYPSRSVISIKVKSRCSPVNCLNYSQSTFLENHLRVTTSVYTKVNSAYAPRHSPFRNKLEKLEQGVKYVQS